MIILHDSCSYLIHSYLKIMRDKGIHEYYAPIPSTLSRATIHSASYLHIKTGMSTGISYNWYFQTTIQNMDKLQCSDIKIRYFYTNRPEQ